MNSAGFPRYSVLMTIYKSDNPNFFKLSLQSMVNQTVKPDEIVIVKDGTITTALQDVIDGIQKNTSVEIVQVSLSQNVGLGMALNYGLKQCKNELIARMDADDYSMPNRCELQLNAFVQNPNLDIIGTSVEEFIDDINNVVSIRSVPITNDDIYRFAKKRDPFNHPTVMYRKSLLERVGGYSDYRKNQDTDLWIRCLQLGAVCQNLEERVFRFRFDKNTFKKRKNWLNTKILIEIRYKSWRSGFNSLGDFLMVATTQLSVYILPLRFQAFLYRRFLRGE